MVHMKGTIKGKVWKFSRQYHGPYHVVTVTETNAEVRLVDDPTAELIFVSLDRVKPGYPDVSWTGHTKWKERKNSSNTKKQASESKENREEATEPYTGLITRSRSKQLNSMSRVLMMYACELLSSVCM